MIVFDLDCSRSGDRFEAWFRSNADYEEQLKRGLVQCPFCHSSEVAKAPMAPRLPASVGAVADIAEATARLAILQAEVLKNSRWVGERFSETARAMHLGEIETAAVHGRATPEQARSLVEDGVPVAPLPLPVVPPDQVN